MIYTQIWLDNGPMGYEKQPEKESTGQKKIVTEISKNFISPTCFDLNPGEHIQSSLSHQRRTLEKLAERAERNRLIKSYEKKDTVTVTKEKVNYWESGRGKNVLWSERPPRFCVAGDLDKFSKKI